MASRKTNPQARAGKRGSKQTERPVTARELAKETVDGIAERQQAFALLLEQGQFDCVRDAHFYAGDHSLPIAALPAPKPCPYCGTGQAPR